jgi:hypothetical protein
MHFTTVKIFHLTLFCSVQFEDSTSPLHMERGEVRSISGVMVGVRGML